ETRVLRRCGHETVSEAAGNLLYRQGTVRVLENGHMRPEIQLTITGQRPHRFGLCHIHQQTCQQAENEAELSCHPNPLTRWQHDLQAAPDDYTRTTLHPGSSLVMLCATTG